MIRLNVREQQVSLQVKPAVVVTAGGMPYEGDYEVTPTVDGFTLPTKRKVMMDDVTVKEIPFFNVGNTTGGSTVYIGSEIELS